MFKHYIVTLGVVLASASLTTTSFAAKVKTENLIKTESLGDGFYMLVGPGGNIGVLSGEDGLFVIDDKYTKNGEEIIQRLSEISDKPVRFVFNTHYHSDHTGGNEVLKTTGATIVAHENVRTRMGTRFENKVFNSTVKATDPALWPTLTYSEAAAFYLNGQSIRAVHTPAAHTDGDSIVYFAEGDVLHMGDTFFNGIFPYVDVSSGGTVQGMIAAQNRALQLAGENTKIIPGHGPLATRADLVRHRDMLQTVLARVSARVEKGESREEIIKAKPLSDLSQYDGGFISAKTIIILTYDSVTGNSVTGG